MFSESGTGQQLPARSVYQPVFRLMRGRLRAGRTDPDDIQQLRLRVIAEKVLTGVQCPVAARRDGPNPAPAVGPQARDAAALMFL